MAKDKKKNKKVSAVHMFKDRDIAHLEASHAIMEHAEAALEMIAEKVRGSTSLFKKGVMSWSPQLFHLQGDGLVVLDLTVEFPVGTKVKLDDGTKVEVTEDNKAYFDKGIVIAVSSDLLDITNRKQLKKLLDQQPEESAFPGGDDSLGDGQIMRKMKRKKKDRKAEAQQDETPLTDKEMRAILLQARNPSGVKH